jgi:hypothetical protein
VPGLLVAAVPLGLIFGPLLSDLDMSRMFSFKFVVRKIGFSPKTVGIGHAGSSFSALFDAKQDHSAIFAVKSHI